VCQTIQSHEDVTSNRFDAATEKCTVLGQHGGSVSRIAMAHSINQLITGSWDHTIRVWDSRAAQSAVLKCELQERVYDMDISPTSSLLVVGLAGRTTEIYDVRKMEEPMQKRESSLKYMTRAVACMHNGEGTL
jgi:cell cycle arrest protein BUB3